MGLIRTCVTENYSYIFNQQTGFFARWGKTREEDPQYSPIGPEIADIEISAGKCSGNCPWCYKSNSSAQSVEYMPLDIFKRVFKKLPKNIMQIAFGITDINANPDTWAIMEYCRAHEVVPNITINGNVLPEDIDRLSKLCGAVAVSNYRKDTCYWAVESLAAKGLKQVNIHQLLCEETFDKCMGLLKDKQEDKRLAGLNAIVFLLLKPKGKRNTFTPLKDPVKYKALIDYALDNEIPIGFDSCSANSFLRAIKGHKHEARLSQCAEPCESTCFSMYIDVDAKAYPCSFSVGEPGIEPIDMLKVNDFMTEVWNGPEFSAFRDKLMSGCRSCPLWNVEI